MANTFDLEMSQLEGSRKIYAQGVSAKQLLSLCCQSMACQFVA
jgi:hypothetical protein